MKICYLLLFIFVSSFLSAQPFISKTPGKPLTFVQIQRQFHEWTKGKDLKKEKYWKYFKRWETDMQFHTNARGEAVDPAPYINEVLMAASEKSGSSSRTFSPSWYPVGPSAVPANQTGYMENGIGRINCIAFHPNNPSTYFVGVAQGGVWKTTNNGSSWTPLTDNLPITRISDICIDPNNPDIMYISVCDFAYVGVGLKLDGRKRNTHYGLGVYKTTDGGLSWQPSGLSFQLTNGDASLIKEIAVSKSNSNRLVACGASGMYTSSDAGATWTKKLDSLFWDMVQDPVNPNILYAASGWVKNSGEGYAGIYKSTDFGNTWTMLSTGIPGTGAVQRIKLAIAPSDNNYIYAIAVDSQRGLHGLYKSTNAGSSWQFIDPGVNILGWDDGLTPGGQGTYDLALLVDAQNKQRIYAGGINLWGSDDGGQTFGPVSHWTLFYGPTVHGDIHFLEQQPLTGNYFVCNDGGIYRTANMMIGNWTDAYNGVPWPTLWTNISSGMGVTSFYRISSSRNSRGRLLGGAQDNASFYYDGFSWSTILGGDGMDNYLDPADDNLLIGSSQFGNFMLSTDGGASSFGITPNINSEPAEWTTPFVADYNQPGTFYAGFSNVYKSDDGGFLWSQISSFPSSGIYNNEISALAVAPANSNVIYACKRVRYEYSIPGSVYRTSDGGSTWTNVTAGLPDSLYYTSADVSPGSSNTAYITMAGFSAGNKVFRTSDGGGTWQNISYNLPNIPVNCVKTLPGTGDILIGTDIGVYVLQSGSSVWTLKSQGLPNVIISDIEVNPALNKIYVSTFGRGIWGMDLDQFVSAKQLAALPLQIELFPTVSDGSFSIRISGEQPSRQAFDLEIIDITGKLAFTAKLQGANLYDQHLSLPPGAYFAKLRGGDFYGVRRFIIQ
jgi:photosystem II stability/assembly factor-like uncharacterized protein